FFSRSRRHTSFSRDWSSDVCSSDLRSKPPHCTAASSHRHQATLLLHRRLLYDCSQIKKAALIQTVQNFNSGARIGTTNNKEYAMSGLARSYHEKRDFIRMQVSAPATLTLSNGNHYRLTCIDLSSSGAQLLHSEALPEETTGRLVISSG